MQTKKETHQEIMLNQIIGIIIGWFLVTYIVIPASHYVSAEIAGLISTVLFFISSYSRSYILRRIFNQRLHVRIKS